MEGSGDSDFRGLGDLGIGGIVGLWFRGSGIWVLRNQRTRVLGDLKYGGLWDLEIWGLGD